VSLPVVPSAVFTVLRSNVVWSKASWRRPRRLLIVAAAALVPVLAGCEAGNNAPTLNWHYPTVGSGEAVQDMSIRNVFVLGGPGTSALPAGSSAGLFLALYNTGHPDRLVSIQAPGTATAVTLAAGGVKVGTDAGAYLTGPAPEVVLTGLTRRLRSGSLITIVLNFQTLGAVTLRVPVLAQAAENATFSPPAPTPTATPKNHPMILASGSATASPSPSAS
jgi:copper(I)-binding protein